MSEKKLIKIPRQIRLKTEFFEGFGIEELIKTVFVGAISAILAFIWNRFTGNTIIATLFVIGIIIVSVIALIKGNNNFSMADTISNILKFEFMQKEYKYERGEFYSKFISKKEKHKS